MKSELAKRGFDVAVIKYERPIGRGTRDGRAGAQ